MILRLFSFTSFISFTSFTFIFLPASGTLTS
jgi:hypothetical protein